MGATISVLSRSFTFSIQFFIPVVLAIFVVKLWSILNRSMPAENLTLLLKNKLKRLDILLLICLEQDLYNNDQIKSAIKRLEEITPNTLSFNDCNKCEKWLMKYNDDKKIVLIISNTFGEQIVPHIHLLSSIKVIDVYCVDRKNNNQLTEKYSKVHSNVFDFNILIQQALEDLEYIKITENQRFRYSPYMLTESIDKQKSLEQNKEIQEGMYSYLK
jgi:hypothetical protein